MAYGATPNASHERNRSASRAPPSRLSVFCRRLPEASWALAALSARGLGSSCRSVRERLWERWPLRPREVLRAHARRLTVPREQRFAVCLQTRSSCYACWGWWLRHREQCPWRWGGGVACSQRGLSFWGSSPRQRRLRRSYRFRNWELSQVQPSAGLVLQVGAEFGKRVTSVASPRGIEGSSSQSKLDVPWPPCCRK